MFNILGWKTAKILHAEHVRLDFSGCPIKGLDNIRHTYLLQENRFGFRRVKINSEFKNTLAIECKTYHEEVMPWLEEAD